MIFLTLFLEFFKIGAFCFGGAFGMIPLIEEVVLSHAWLTEEEFYNFIGVCESTPGPIAVNMATYIGSVTGSAEGGMLFGILGALCATLGVVLPSFIIIILVASIFTRMTDNKYFKAALSGIKPVIIALILSTGAILLMKSIGYISPTAFSLSPRSAIIFLLIFAIYHAVRLLFKRKISSISIILISAALGVGATLLF